MNLEVPLHGYEDIYKASFKNSASLRTQDVLTLLIMSKASLVMLK